MSNNFVPIKFKAHNMNKRRWKEDRERMLEIVRSPWKDPKMRQMASEKAKKQHQDPEFRKIVLAKANLIQETAALAKKKGVELGVDPLPLTMEEVKTMKEYIEKLPD